MGEPQYGVRPRAAGRVAGEAVVEHMDEAILRVAQSRPIHLGCRDRLVVVGVDVPDRFEPDDTVGKPSISSIIRLPQPASPADASSRPAFSSSVEALSIWAVEVRIAFASACVTASAPSCS